MSIIRITLATTICLLSFLVFLLPTVPAEAAVSQDVIVIATPDVGIGIINFTVIYVSDTQIDFTWGYDDAVNAMIRAKYNAAPDDIPDEDTEPADGYLVYYGSGTSSSDTSMNLDLNTGPIHYTIWGQRADNKWFVPTSSDNVEGIAMTLIALILIPLILTVAMFHSRNAMLGFPSALFWAILGGYAYTLSTTPWGDWQFYLAFASLMGMVPFTSLAAFGLREKRDTIAETEMDKDGEGEDGFVDEKPEPNVGGGRERPPALTRREALHDRARQRKERRKGGGSWGPMA